MTLARHVGKTQLRSRRESEGLMGGVKEAQPFGQPIEHAKVSGSSSAKHWNTIRFFIIPFVSSLWIAFRRARIYISI